LRQAKISHVIYKDSRWWQLSVEIRKKVIQSIRQDDQPGLVNRYRNKEFAEYLLRHTFTYAPFFLRFFSNCGRKDFQDWTRPNNAYVERYHRRSKDNIRAVHGAKPSIVDYAKHTRDMQLLDNKQVILKIPNSSGLFRARKMPDDNPNATSQWKGKIKKDPLFYDAKHVNSATLQLSKDVDVFVENHQPAQQDDLEEEVDYRSFDSYYNYFEKLLPTTTSNHRSA
jgi:hypothetical protein